MRVFLTVAHLHALRLTFTPSTLAGGSWWLPGVTLSFGRCRANHITESAGARSKGR